MIVKMLETPQNSMFEGIIPYLVADIPGEIVINSLQDYLPVISTLDHFQREVIICVTYLHVYLHP